MIGNILAKVKIFRLQMRTKHPLSWPLILGFISLGCVISGGTAGYIFIEGWSFIESIYMVVISLSTVGYMEVRPLTVSGRVLTMSIIFGGVGTFFYLVGSFTQIFVEGRLQNVLGRRRVQKIINTLQNHIIVCGYGRIGSVVAREIEKEGHNVVVIEKSSEVLKQLEQEGRLFVNGDATVDEILLLAGLKHAKYLITSLDQDAANVYVTLTARQLNPNLTIVARTDNESHVSRLKQAGADRVVMPHIIGGLRMAQSVLRPTVSSLLDLAARGDIDLLMEELPVSEHSELVGKMVKDSGVRPRFEVIIVGIKKSSGQMVFNPGPETVIHAGDLLISLGKPGKLRELQRVCVPD
jgi:voltage-gated potassium channel